MRTERQRWTATALVALAMAVMALFAWHFQMTLPDDLRGQITSAPSADADMCRDAERRADAGETVPPWARQKCGGLYYEERAADGVD